MKTFRIVLALSIMLCVCGIGNLGAAPTPEEAYLIGMEAFVYFYPIVSMDVTRRQMTNVEPGKVFGRGPMNTFTHTRSYPAVDFKDVVRPNFDTLYSVAWVDLTREPVIVSAPDTAGRYYLLPMLDMWTNVFAVPGKRTSGTAAVHFALVPPGRQGDRLPEGVQKIESPTSYVWIIGRTQTNGPGDYSAVHKIQDGYRLTPLSQWGKTPVPASFKIDPTVDMKTPPLVQVNRMSAKAYFSYANELLNMNSPQYTDWSMVTRFKRIGIERGKTFSWDSLDSKVQDALSKGAADGLKAMYAKIPTIGRVVNGWQMNTDSIGVYGNYYLKRAIVAMIGLGANQPDDAVYPLNIADADGQPVKGQNKYILHFSKDELPPVEAFWSLTMYDEDGFQVPNPIKRYAIGDRDRLKFNADGSLDLYIQHESPGKDRESNWLPGPASGTLGLTMRLYAPKMPAIYGKWAPPAVQKVEGKEELLPR